MLVIVLVPPVLGVIEPVHWELPPLAVHEVGLFVTDHVSTELYPSFTGFGLAVKVTTGGPEALLYVTVTLTGALDPAVLEHTSVKTVFVVMFVIS